VLASTVCWHRSVEEKREIEKEWWNGGSKRRSEGGHGVLLHGLLCWQMGSGVGEEMGYKRVEI
jgi:hypothetical protein